MIKALLLDMDGLLIDSEVCAFQVYRDFLNERGHDFSLDFYSKNMSGHKAVDNIKLVFDKYQITGDLDKIQKEIIDREFAYYQAGIPTKYGAIELLDYLKAHNYKIALATSSLIPRAMAAINYNNLDHYFDTKVFGPDVEHGKPHPDLFLKACEKLGLKPKECLVLEDAESGIMAAHNGDIPVICIPDVKQPSEEYAEKCVAVLKDLTKVIDYLEENNK